jgi:DNA-binding transcriptional LysR family regulator
MKQLRYADIRLPRVFAQVIEARGLSAAQHRLNVAPFTTSTQISAFYRSSTHNPG